MQVMETAAANIADDIGVGDRGSINGGDGGRIGRIAGKGMEGGNVIEEERFIVVGEVEEVLNDKGVGSGHVVGSLEEVGSFHGGEGMMGRKGTRERGRDGGREGEQ